MIGTFLREEECVITVCCWRKVHVSYVSDELGTCIVGWEHCTPEAHAPVELPAKVSRELEELRNGNVEVAIEQKIQLHRQHISDEIQRVRHSH